jgi:hypothetical protein
MFTDAAIKEKDYSMDWPEQTISDWNAFTSYVSPF